LAVQAVEEIHAFLPTEPALPGDKRLARLAVALSVLAFCGTVWFVRLPLEPIPAVIPAYDGALWISDTLTSALLFSQFTRLRSRALLVLATGYLFDAFMIVPHALSFPGVFAPAGLLGGGSQTTAWLYVFLHTGFPLFVLAFAILARRPGDTVAGSPGRAIAGAIAAAAMLAVALTVLATAGNDSLPEVIRDGDYALIVTKGISPAVWVVSLCVLLVLWSRRDPTVLELWLTVAMVAWVFAIAFAAVVGSHRFDLGSYAARFYGLLAASSVLGVLLFKMNRLYDNIADALALAEVRNTELARSREEFARVQRFEAIGQLVGGIAHDFNNLLTVITGAVDLTLRESSLPARARRMLEMSMTSAHRGSELAGHLLIFARKQVLQPEVVNLNEVVANLRTFMARTLGEMIELVTELSPVVWPVRLDRGQCETALVNLMLSARDALDGHGRIVISTCNVVVDATTVPDLPAGEYTRIGVSDAGRATAPELVARAEIGKESGLGLSQVYAFVRGAGGVLRIVSEAGKGTTAEIYLPKSTDHPSLMATLMATAARMPIRTANGEATILVVEKDPGVLNTAVSGLIDLGYNVEAATNAHEALAILCSDRKIDLLFSDIVMPGGMNGAQLAVEARRLRPSLKVLLTSGYTAPALSEDHGVSEPLDVLRKPYQREELQNKLRLVIGG
jgi:signal transduction histidine kinase